MYWFSLQTAALAGVGEAESGSQEVHQGLPQAWQALTYLIYHLLLPKSICMDLDWK